MKLDHIRAYAEKYATHLSKQRFIDEDYQWEVLRNFQTNWDDAEADFAFMYDRSIRNDRNRTLWQSTGFEPKRMMLNFAREQADSVRTVFRDFFDETKQPENRIDRFVYYCDTLLKAWRARHPDHIENNHYHSDYRMPFFYLAMRYPDKYTLYDFEDFKGALRNFGAVNPPQLHDPERFVKVSRTIWGIISKEPTLGLQYGRLIVSDRAWQGETMLPVAGFYKFVAKQRL